MTSLQLLGDIARIAVQAGFWAAVVFPVLTALYWPWWSSLWGWNIVALDIAIAAALLGLVLQVEFGLIPGHTPGHVLLWTETISLCTVPLIIVWRAVLTWLAQRRSPAPDYDAIAAVLREQGYTVTKVATRAR